MIILKIYTADFETTTKETSTEETWVWCYGVRELYNKDSFKWGTTIEQFMTWCSKSSKEIYFHNLKFDGMFILSWLLENGFEHTSERKAVEKQFKTVISREGIFYQIEVIWSVKGKRVVRTIFKDSYKKLPFTVSRIAKAFNLEFSKGDIDYNKVRPKGYTPTKEELDYQYRDVEIMAQALEIQLNEGLEKMTIGADSLNVFKTMITPEEFKRLFPVLSADMNEDIRRSYKGGFTYVNPIHKGKDIGVGQVYDVNSLYPAVMYYKEMPYGIPAMYEGKYKENETFPLYIQELVCEFDVKEGHIPTIQLKGDHRFKSTEYLTSSDDKIVKLMLTSVDLKLFFDHYDVVVHEWTYGYMFRKISNLFNGYIDKYMEIKKNSEGAQRELAKLLLNNLYGKFSTSTDATDKVPVLNENGVLKLEVSQEDKKKESIYTAVGSFITSYAREITIRSAQKLGERFIYADTDSLHLTGLEVPDIDIDAKELGKWKFEGQFKKGRFIRAKTYIEDIAQTEDGKDTTIENAHHYKTKVTCAGMNDKIKAQVTWDNFKTGQRFFGKLTPKMIKGGVVLVDDYFTIKIPD